MRQHHSNGELVEYGKVGRYALLGVDDVLLAEHGSHHLRTYSARCLTKVKALMMRRDVFKRLCEHEPLVYLCLCKRARAHAAYHAQAIADLHARKQ
jgi:hypothetical protein